MDIRVSTYDFAGMPAGGLPVGTLFRFGDFDTGSGDVETITLSALNAVGVAFEEWRSTMKSKSLVVVLALATSLATFGTPRKADAEEHRFHLTMSAGISELVGDAGDRFDTGGGLAAGVGFDFSENIALEGEFIGSWAPLDGSPSGYAASYAGIFGPRFSIALTENGKFALYAGGGIGVVHDYEHESGLGSTDDTRFGWQTKAGAEYSLSDSFDLVLDFRYVATAEGADDGAFAAGIGFKLYPGF